MTCKPSSVAVCVRFESPRRALLCTRKLLAFVQIGYEPLVGGYLALRLALIRGPLSGPPFLQIILDRFEPEGSSSLRPWMRLKGPAHFGGKRPCCSSVWGEKTTSSRIEMAGVQTAFFPTGNPVERRWAQTIISSLKGGTNAISGIP